MADRETIEKKYHATVHTLADLYKDVVQRLSQTDKDISAYHATFLELKESAALMEHELESRKSIINNLEKCLTNINGVIDGLKSKIVQLEEENKSFTKVSQIIAYEKENARLKSEVSRLSELVESKNAPKPTIDEQHDSSTSHLVEPEDCKVIEKKINGKKYYVAVGTDEETVFGILENGKIGQKLGVIRRFDGKAKVVWA